MHRIRSITLIGVAILLAVPGAGTSARAGNPDVSITAGPLLDGYIQRGDPYCSAETATINFNVEISTGAATLVAASPCGVVQKVFPQGSCYFDQSDSWIFCRDRHGDDDLNNDEIAFITSRLPIRRFAMQLDPEGELWDVYGGAVTGLS